MESKSQKLEQPSRMHKQKTEVSGIFTGFGITIHEFLLKAFDQFEYINKSARFGRLNRR